MADIWEDIRKELRGYNTTYEFLNNISELMKQYPDFNLDCLSKGQLYSKLWIIKELKKLDLNLDNVALLCGWYAVLANMLFDNFKITSISSFDIDPSCEKVADELNLQHVINEWKFKAHTRDINTFSFNGFQTVINLSCEHLLNQTWFKNIKTNTTVILQSNDFAKIEDHVNCVQNVDELILQFPMKELYYCGSINLNDYNRYMVIGRK
jgi:hypothetical protein